MERERKGQIERGEQMRGEWEANQIRETGGKIRDDKNKNGR